MANPETRAPDLTDRRPGPARMIALGLTAGLLVGTIEAIAVVTVMVTIPGGLNWRTSNGPEILFFGPAVNAIVFGALAALFSLGTLIRSRIRFDSVFVLVAGILAGYLGAMMPGPVLQRFAVLMFALGCGVFARQLYRSRFEWIWTHLGRIAAVLVSLMLLSIPAIYGSRWLAERRAVSRMPAAPAGRPNLLLLVIDTQRADHLSLYGYQRKTSPVLDSVGARGVVFERAKSSSSWTLPSHASMMTGQPQHVHQAGLMQRPYLDRRLPTVAERLTEAGYATAGFVANTFWAGRRSGIDRGFIHYSDYYRNLADGLARVTIGRLFFHDFLPRVRRTDIPGRRRAPDMNRDLLGWIDGLEPGRPFFAFVNYFDVHPPLEPPAQFRTKFGSGQVQEEEAGLDLGALPGRIQLPSAKTLDDRRARYDESILSWDAAFADLLRALDSRGKSRNTLIVVTSDHGESFGEHGLLSHGHSLYRDQIDVPLVLSWPARIERPERIDGPVSIERIPATLLAAAGVARGEIPGPSLLDPEEPAPPVLVEVGRRARVTLGWPSSAGWVAGLMTPEWRYLRRQDGTEELFDAVGDPAEATNLATDPAHRAVSDSLRAVLEGLAVSKGLERKEGGEAGRRGGGE